MSVKACCPDCRMVLPSIVDESAPLVCDHCGFKAIWENGVLQLLPSSQKNDKSLSFMSWPCSHTRFYKFISYLKTKAETPYKINLNPYIAKKTILDIGCGPTLKGIHRQDDVKNAHFYVGMDCHQPFLAANRRENPGSSFMFVQGRAERIPFPEGAFDTTLVFFLLHHLPKDLTQIFSEIWRVTREYCIIFDHIRSSAPIVSSLQSMYWRVADGGIAYHKLDNWLQLFHDHHLLEFSRSGPFGQVFRAVIEKNRKRR